MITSTSSTAGLQSAGLSRTGLSVKAPAAASGPAFGQALERALKAVSQTQAEASKAQMSVQLEKDGANHGVDAKGQCRLYRCGDGAQ
jgi:flagellar hook-basal body complex protein FliE